MTGASDDIPAPRLLVGTSGWSYDHWSGCFYPEHLPAADRLTFYAERFSTVEINATFYRLPSESTVSHWRDGVPTDFRFAVKGSRYITHIRRLADTDDAVARFLDRVGGLRDRLAVVLWQLPPTLQRDDDRLDAFLAPLAATPVRHAVEFRHESWFAEEVYALLRSHNAALVSASGDDLAPAFVPTADFVYARFHGTATYHGAYARPALEPWAAFLADQLAEGRDCYAYFNNDAEGHAPVDAQRLLGMVAEVDAALASPETPRRDQERA